MALIFSCLLLAALMLPCSICLTTAVYWNLWEREPTPCAILVVWAALTALMCAGLLATQPLLPINGRPGDPFLTR